MLISLHEKLAMRLNKGEETTQINSHGYIRFQSRLKMKGIFVQYKTAGWKPF